MRRETLFLLTFMLLFLSTGCSTTHIIKPDEPLHIRKYATLFKKDFEKIDVSEFYSSGDSIRVLHYDTHELLKYSKSDVTKIIVRNRSKGALQGLIIGAFGSASLCYLLCEDNPQDALGSKEAGAFLSFFFGGFGGTIVGFLTGSNDIYEFVTDKPVAMISNDVNEINADKFEEIASKDVNEINTDKPEEKEGIEESGKADVEESKPPAIEIVKDPKIEETRVKKRMIAISAMPPKTPSKYYAFRIGTGFGNIPTIKSLDGSTIDDNSGSGIGGAYQFWYARRSNIHIGLIAGGIEFIQEDIHLRNTRFVEYISLTARKYIKNKNEYIEGAIGFSRLSQKSVKGINTVLFDSSINGFGISAGIGSILIRGEKYELLLYGNFAYNFFKGGRNSALFGFNVELMLTRLITK